MFMLLSDFIFFRYYISSKLRSLKFHWWRVLCAHVCHILLHLSSLWVSFFFLSASYATYSQFSILCDARLKKEESEQHKLCDIGCKISKRSTRYIWTYNMNPIRKSTAEHNDFRALSFCLYSPYNSNKSV